MKPSLAAAIEINERWDRCLNGERIHLESFPSNEEIAAIIEKHMSSSSKSKSSDSEK